MLRKVTRLKQRKKKEWSAKKVAYFSTLRNAWHTNHQSSAKALLSVSAAGIGLLIGLSSVLSFSSNIQFYSFIFSVLFFGTTIILCISNWKYNAKCINARVIMLNNRPARNKNQILKLEEAKKAEDKFKKFLNRLDRFTIIFFASAIVFALIVAGCSISERLTYNKQTSHPKTSQETPSVKINITNNGYMNITPKKEISTMSDAKKNTHVPQIPASTPPPAPKPTPAPSTEKQIHENTRIIGDQRSGGQNAYDEQGAGGQDPGDD